MRMLNVIFKNTWQRYLLVISQVIVGMSKMEIYLWNSRDHQGPHPVQLLLK